MHFAEPATIIIIVLVKHIAVAAATVGDELHDSIDDTKKRSVR